MWAKSAVIEKTGYDPLNKLIIIDGPADGHSASVQRGSRFGWGMTYEYFFRLGGHKGELLDIKGVVELLRSTGLRLSTISIFGWMNDGQLPRPVVQPRDDRSAFGARWRQGDIEAWQPEAKRLLSAPKPKSGQESR